MESFSVGSISWALLMNEGFKPGLIESMPTNGFDLRAHHIFLEPQQDPQKECLVTQFQISTSKFDAIIEDWPTKWRVHVIDDQLSVEEDM